MKSEKPTFKAWFCEAIERVRVHSTPGGVSLSPEEAKELREQLDEAIRTAEQNR